MWTAATAAYLVRQKYGVLCAAVEAFVNRSVVQAGRPGSDLDWLSPVTFRLLTHKKREVTWRSREPDQ